MSGLKCLLAATTFVVVASACVPSQPGPHERLRPCTSDEAPADALCGTVTVYEDRHAASGRRIDLWVVVLPAIGSAPEPDPLFFLAGGPGQGAAQLVPEVHTAFRRVQRTRDIVLVDQRGTGRSNPLDCRPTAGTLRELTEGIDAALARLRTCLAGYDADVRLYTTDLAMDDLDEVRAYLGYERVNLYGGSYGTRAALVYARRHGAHVRAMVLDGVAPTDMRIPLFTARDAQRALDRALAACAADAGCRRAFPDLSTRVRALLNRLDASPRTVRLTHPRTGVAEEVTVDGRIVANILFSSLYSPLTASIVPALVARAEADDFQGLFALALAGDTGEHVSLGMQLSVLCSEDASRLALDEGPRPGTGTVFGAHLMDGQIAACAIWPTATLPAEYYAPVVSDVPTLVLSGDVDPVTPPSWGDEVVRHLGRARHLVVPATGHGVVATPCGNRLVTDFIERPSFAHLRTGCLQAVRRPPFFLTPAGPDPAPAGEAP